MQNYSFGVTSSFWDRVFGTLQPPPKRFIVPVMQDSLLQENSNKEDNNAE
jgi:sterol desaturase/sphingolipid hydroxylase (fatty acid hydroxylase superfamily)